MTDDPEVLQRVVREPDEVLRYGSEPDQIADLYRPSAGPNGLVVFLHGGFWRQVYDRVHARPLAVALAEAGWAVLLPEYARTGGAGGWPRTFDDVTLAAAVLPALAGRHPDEDLVLAGHSAGGHLALWLAATVGAAVGLTRTAALGAVADLARADRWDLGNGATRLLLGGGPEQHPERWLAADPAQLPTPHGDVVLLHARDDDAVPFEIAVSYCAAHPTAALVEVPDGHFGVIDPASSAWPAVLDAVSGVAPGAASAALPDLP